MKLAETYASFAGPELERLNRNSLDHSFIPQKDIDWSADTTDEEYEALYEAWSLLLGSGLDASLAATERVRYAKAQQIILMRITALLERHGLESVAGLYDTKAPQALTDYIGHFMKEEIYHYSMFVRAIEQLQRDMPGPEPAPSQRFSRALRLVFASIALIPSRRLRLCMVFIMFRFAEQVTLYAHDMVKKTLKRPESLVAQVWAKHAIDEARHIKFDDMVIERMRPRGLFRRLPELLALPGCVLMSFLINSSEIRVAQSLGVKVRLWQLPRLVKQTRAPFKRRVFSLVQRIWKDAGVTEEVATG